MEIDFTTALIARPFHAQSLLSRYGKEYLPEMRYYWRCCLFVCFCSFSFFYHPALQKFYCINFHLSARKRRQPPQKKPCCLYHDPPESKSDYFAGLARFAEFSSRYYMYEESEFEVATCAWAVCWPLSSCLFGLPFSVWVLNNLRNFQPC